MLRSIAPYTLKLSAQPIDSIEKRCSILQTRIFSVMTCTRLTTSKDYSIIVILFSYCGYFKKWILVDWWSVINTAS